MKDKGELLDLMRCAIYYPEDSTYRFFNKDFMDLLEEIKKLNKRSSSN